MVSEAVARTGRESGADDERNRASAEDFQTLEAAFAQAMRARPDAVCEACYTFAGQPVRTRIVGRGLAELITRPFMHLRAEQPRSAGVELSIDLWDECETGIACPLGNAKGDHRATWYVANGVLTASLDGRLLRFQRPQSQTWLDREARRIVGSRPCGGRVPVYERSKPLSSLLSIWCSDRDIHVVHASLVSRNGQGVLIPGPSGAGKSTVALSCLRAGFGYLGDDWIGLEELSGGSLVGHSLYSTARLDPRQLARFPLLADSAVETDDPFDDKWLIPLLDVFPERLESAAEIRALALPRVVDAERSRICPASRSEALLRLAPSSLLMFLSPAASGLERMARLVQRVPSYWLELGRDVSAIPARVDELLAEATSS